MNRGELNKAVLINAQSALDSAGLVDQHEGQVSDFSIYDVEFSAGTSAGAVSIEESENRAFAGAGGWANLGTATWSAAAKKHSIRVSGPSENVRARISTAVVGGTVTVKVSTFRNR